MRRIAARSCLVLLACCGACSSVAVNQDRVKTFATVPFEDAKFVALSPNRPNSPQIAVLWGDPATGPSAMFIKIRKGVLPLHVHGSYYHLMVIRGSLKRWNEEQTEDDVKALGPGSYLFEPADQPHANSCLADECVLYLVWGGRQSARNVEPRTK